MYDSSLNSDCFHTGHTDRFSVFRSLFAYKLVYGEWECVYWLLPAAMQPPGCLVESESVISPDPALWGRLAPPAISPQPHRLNGQVIDTNTHTHTQTPCLPFNLLSLDGPPLPHKGHISLVITGESQGISHLTVYTIIRSNLELPSLEKLQEGES